jgi:hypothetical protein
MAKDQTIGIPCLKIRLQRAVVMVLEAIYEQDFWTAHMDIDQSGQHTRRFKPWKGLMGMNSRLAAGVLGRRRTEPPRDPGSPQAEVSPIVSNIYHEVWDKWFEQIVKPVLIGEAFAIS